MNYEHAINTLKRSGTLVDAVNAKASYRAYKNLDGAPYKLKDIGDIHARIPYVVDHQGRYIPQCAPINIAPLVQYGEKRFALTNELMNRFKTACFRCGEDFCSWRARNCLYNTPDGGLTWEICSTCKNGYHSPHICKANKPLN